MKTIIQISLCSVLTFAGCVKKTVNETEAGCKVTGTVRSARGFEKDVTVAIDRVLNWTTATDADGRFEIDGVTPGAHSLSLSKTGSDGSFSEKTSSIVVNGDLTLEAIVLPVPVVLLKPVQSSNQVRLAWHPSDASDFREYKLYRKEDPGLDETTGKLIAVSTYRADTVFVDKTAFGGQTYYYRIFVMNEYGRVGGSNLESIKVVALNPVPDGDFENPSFFSQYWSFQLNRPDEHVSLDSTVSHSGKYSLHIGFVYNNSGTAVPVQLLSPLVLQTNVTYKLSFFLKVRGKRNNTNDLFVNVMQGSDYPSVNAINANNDYSVRDVDVDWTPWTITFMLTSNTPINLIFIGNNENIWIDDVALLPI
jgi:hypothetical protein